MVHWEDKVKAMNDGLISEIEASSVEVRLGKKASVEDVKALNPSSVFVAVGASPSIPPIPGIDKDNVQKAEDVLLGKVKPVGRVLIIGSGLTGLETAEVLAEKGHPVTVVEMQKEIGPGINRTILIDLMMRFKKFNPALLPNHKLLSISDQGVMLMNQQTSQGIFVEADTVVLALGVTPRRDMVAAFRQSFSDVRVVGDANRGGRIQEAIKDGFQEAFAFTSME